MAGSSRPITVVSLGTTVLDDIHQFEGDLIPSVIGGSGLYATLGARLATPMADSKGVGCLILAGDDFPAEAEDRIRDWQVNVHMAQQGQGNKVARGRLQYLDPNGDSLKFEYISPPLRASVEDIVKTPLLTAQAFHLFGPPEVVMNLVPAITQARQQHYMYLGRPFFVWEPAPATCNIHYREAHIAAAKLVDIFSPNQKELNSLVGAHSSSGEFCTDGSSSPLAMAFARQLVQEGFGPDNDGVIVVRCGSWGVAVLRRDATTRFYPAYYNSKWKAARERGPGEVRDDGIRVLDEKKVLVNSTGAGNAFLGGFIVGWLAAEDDNEIFQEACIRGSVSASFVVEQIGMPARSVVDGEELWNGESAEARINQFRDWIKSAGKFSR